MTEPADFPVALIEPMLHAVKTAASWSGWQQRNNHAGHMLGVAELVDAGGITMPCAKQVERWRHGDDLIDVITASSQATGGVMRKVSDVQNGPFVGEATPLIIVSDRSDKRARAENEIAILGAVTRAMPLTALLAVRH